MISIISVEVIGFPPSSSLRNCSLTNSNSDLADLLFPNLLIRFFELMPFSIGEERGEERERPAEVQVESDTVTVRGDESDCDGVCCPCTCDCDSCDCT